MVELNDSQIYQEIGKIVNQLLRTYPRTLNVGCVPNASHYLSIAYLTIFCVSPITTNGKHYGVEVRGRVFDNLSAEGMTRENWLKDFHCQSEEFIITEVGE